MSAPLVSVVIATHNRAELLGETVRSVLAQTYRRLEVIVVDDGSTDGTPEVAASFDDPRLRYVYTRNWGGPARPRNVGLRVAHGEFVAFCDDDDLWHPEKIARQLGVLAEQPAVALVYVLYTRFEAGHDSFEVLPPPRWRVRGSGVFSSLYRATSIPHSGVLARTERLREAGGFDENRDLISCEDADLWIRIARRHPVDYVPDIVLLRYRVLPGSVSRRRLWQTWRAVMTLQRKHRSEAGFVAYARSVIGYGAYFTGMWLRAARAPRSRPAERRE